MESPIESEVDQMFSDLCEMSFGDQAAMIGVLAERRPEIAIELGTFQGGSLALIAPRCTTVHTFDLVSHVDDHLPNVTYHLGDSRKTLPGLLQSLLDQGRTVDFALVDGDHERSAVAADVRVLLDSPALQQCAILVHDAANEGVRAGIRDAGLERPEVRYVDLSFTVPAQRLRALSEGWGGFALIVVDRSGDLWSRPPAVSESMTWLTSNAQSWWWNRARHVRAIKRRAMYGLRPVVRRLRGSRGVRL